MTMVLAAVTAHPRDAGADGWGKTARAATSSADVLELPAEDRQKLEKYLGRGVVGKAVAATPIEDPVSFAGATRGEQLKVRRVHGDDKGETRTVTIKHRTRKDGRRSWRVNAGNETWHGEVDDDGNMIQHSSEDHDQGVVSRFDPPEPIIMTGMKPGQSTKTRIDVKVFDLSRPDKVSHKGYLDLTYTYVGAYEVTVPAGTFEAILLKWNYKGKVGPAKITDDQYWFFVKGLGPIVRIDMKDISAMLIYRDKSKNASVLISRSQK
jgi:hypothetical protein